MSKFYIVQFRKLFFKEYKNKCIIFVPNFENARIFPPTDYNYAYKIAKRVNGEVREIYVEFD